MTLFEQIISAAINGCAICGSRPPLKFWDVELGGLCQDCAFFAGLAEYYLVHTHGICKPRQNETSEGIK